MRRNNTNAREEFNVLMEEISSTVGVPGKADASFTCPVASGDPDLSDPTYCTDLSLDPSLHSCLTDLCVYQHIKLILTLGLCTASSLHLEHSLL